MCNAGFKDFSKRKLSTDLMPNLNPVKHIKGKLKNDFDWTGQQMAQDQFNADLAAQNNRINAVNEQTKRDSLGANGSFTSDSTRRKRTSLLTEDTNRTLLG